MRTSSAMLTYHPLHADVLTFSTRRQGGVSTGAYSSLNINPFCGDTMENVAENAALLSATLQLPQERILLPHQTHGIEVLQVEEEFFCASPEVQKSRLEGVDAVMSSAHGLCIGVSTADCIPVLLYDSAHGAIAAVHAGWRGAVRRIVQRTLNEMHHVYGTCADTVYAVVAPGISIEHYEVGQEVYEAFLSAGFQMDCIARMQEKWHIDLPLCNRLQLQEWGVPVEHIHSTNICTYTNHTDYFSARRLGTKSGRIYNGIMIK